MTRWKHSFVLAAFLAVLVLSVAASAQGPNFGPVTGERQISVEGTDVQLRLFTGLDAQGHLAPHYSVSLDGGASFSEPRATDYTLKIRHQEFDPLAVREVPAVTPILRAANDTNLYVVQFVTQPLEVFRAAVTELGGTVQSYLPLHAHVVRMDPATRDAVTALPYVRWVGSFHPSYRLEPFLADNAAEAEAVYPNGTYTVRVFEPNQKNEVAAQVQALGGQVELIDAGKRNLRVTLTAGQVLELVRHDAIMYINRWGPLQADMDIARAIGGANYIETLAGYDGTGVRGEVIDLGFNVGHADFQTRPLIPHGTIGSDSHGTATSGIVFGDGSADPAARGMLPNGQGIVQSTDAMEGSARYTNTQELVQSPYNAVFQTASVGSPRTLDYNSESADMDDGLFDFDFVICQSQSNAGDQMSRPQAWAKNIISVGGVRHYNTLTKSDDAWAGSASIGPADDGRIKPDLCHFYDNIYTVTTGSTTSYTTSFGGTSGATPIVAGHVGLFFQMWSDGIFGNPVDSQGTVFENRAHMTTAKAMMINTASQYSFSGQAHDLTRVHQGWGMPDVQTLYDLRFKMLIVDETDLLTNFDSTTYFVDVTAGEPALRATLVFADPAGVPFSSVHRVNDLTLKVTSPGGTVYWGNNGLLDGNWSTTGGNPNTLDTVENVFIPLPTAGTWQVEIMASEIVEDGHVETPQLDADYALVVSGVQETLPPLFVSIEGQLPTLVDAATPVDVTAEIIAGDEGIVPGSETLYYRFDSADPFTAVALTNVGGDTYSGTIPGAPCGSNPQYYVSASGDAGTTVTDPSTAPSAFESYEIGVDLLAFSQDFEAAPSWTIENVDLTDGGWERGVPAGAGDRGDPLTDFDGSGQCFLTDNVAGNSDVDGGPTRLTSQRIFAAGLVDPTLTYARWFSKDDPDGDAFVVEISDDDGNSWELVESLTTSTPGWQENSIRVLDFVTLTNLIRLRFSASDNPNDSVVEAGVDAVTLIDRTCTDPFTAGDVTGDGNVDFADILAVIGAWGPCPAPPAACPADVDGNGTVEFADILVVIANWTG